MKPKPDTLYKIGIIGYGVVGKGIHRLFGDSVKTIFDPNVIPDFPGFEVNHYSYNNKESFKGMDMVVVSVMTKELEDGRCDMSIVEETMKWLDEIEYEGVVLIKSTSAPIALVGLVNKFPLLSIVFSPEYMGESKYFTPFWEYPDPLEMKYHSFQIFGGARGNTSFCVDVFIRVMGPHVKFYQTNIRTAALVKYMENTFFATKVTFCNEFYDIAKVYGVDYNELRELWLLDSRVGPMHTAVFPKDRGFGGKCYPKDLRAITEELVFLGYSPELLSAVHRANKRFRSLNSKEKL